MALTPEEITALLTKKNKSREPSVIPKSRQKPTLGFPPPQQYGPLRWVDYALRCANRGCGSPTYCKVQGIPRCETHALLELNEMLFSVGFKGFVGTSEARPTPKPDRIMSATTQAKLDIGTALSKLECAHGINLDKDCMVCKG